MIDEILKQQPEDHEAIKIRAAMRVDSGERQAVAAALQDYKHLLEKQDRDPQVYYGLGRCLQITGDLSGAAVSYRSTLQLNPQYRLAKAGLIEVALARGATEEAIREANSAIAEDPGDLQARLLRATALVNQGRPADARTEIHKILQLSPSYTPAQLQLGLIEIQMRNLKVAEAIFKKLQGAAPGDSSAAAGIATVHAVEGDSQTAYAILQQEMGKSRRPNEMRQMMAQLAFETHQYGEAIKQYQALVSAKFGGASIYRSLAEAFRLNGDSKDWLATLEEAQRAFPGDFLTAALLASALESGGRYQDAIRYYQVALKIQPGEPRVENNLAYLLIEVKGDTDTALRLAHAAAQRSPEAPDFSDTLAWVYVKKGETDAAIHILNSLISKDPLNPTYRYHLGAAYMQKGQAKDARQSLEIALGNEQSPANTQKIRELLARLR